MPDVAWNGSSYLVVWQYDFSDSDIDIPRPAHRRKAAPAPPNEPGSPPRDPLGYQKDQR